jgi:hypothetical protein
VSGSVNVGNFPATQNVSGSVNVGNLPSTQNVAGTVTADPGFPGTPYAHYATGTGLASITVPSGHNLVVQSVSVRVAGTSGDSMNVYLSYTSNGSTSYLFFPVTLAFTQDGNDYYVGNFTTDIYADAGTNVTLNASEVGAGTVSPSFLSVSGYETS